VSPVRAAGTFGFVRKLRNATRSSSSLSVISATAKATVLVLESRHGGEERWGGKKDVGRPRVTD